jgi:potassium-transporting ATPase potassium-binding subunit
MPWTAYCISMLVFSAATLLFTYVIERAQLHLPLNPQHLGAVAPDLAWNTAISFTTNTNWQAYTPESTMSYLTQMLGLATHNFWSAAVGIALAVAFIRGISRREAKTLGNFWVDMTRAILWVLAPICIVYSLALVSQGVVQNFHPYDQAHLVEPQQQTATGTDGKTTTTTVTTQTIAQGPVASQEAIKMLGTNGGGFFNANSAHPFENPTPLSNLLQMFSIFLIPAGLTVTLGQMTGSPRHGWAVFGAMALLWFAGLLTCYWAEAQPNPLLHGVDQQVSHLQSGGNMEGKEVRFGIANSALFATVTTDASCGAVNSMHDSFTPLGGMVPMVNIMLGEIVFGGVGAGMYGMLIFVIISVFIAGLMVGRTPEYLGKKIQAYDVQLAMLYLLIFPIVILTFSAIAILSPNMGLSSLSNHGPHGLSEIIYAYTSAAGNNGSAFAGLNANWYNFSLGLTMFMGRFLMIVPMLAVAGNLAGKKIVPASAGTFPVTTPLFSVLLISVVLLLGALTFFPAISLGPILEHLLMHAGHTF